jgi:hypothetical protein
MIKLPRFAYEYANYKRNQIREMDSRNIYRPIFLMDIDNIVKNPFAKYSAKISTIIRTPSANYNL